VGISSAEVLGLPIFRPSNVIVVEGIASQEALGLPLLTITLFINPTGIPSEEAFGLPVVQGAIIRWKWTHQSGFAGTQTGGWPDTQEALAGTVKNEGET
jgi:hypothetical protein